MGIHNLMGPLSLVGGIGATAMGQPAIGLPLLAAGLGGTIGGAAGGSKGAMMGEGIGGALGAGGDLLGGGQMLGNLASKIGGMFGGSGAGTGTAMDKFSDPLTLAGANGKADSSIAKYLGMAPQVMDALGMGGQGGGNGQQGMAEQNIGPSQSMTQSSPKPQASMGGAAVPPPSSPVPSPAPAQSQSPSIPPNFGVTPGNGPGGWTDGANLPPTQIVGGQAQQSNNPTMPPAAFNNMMQQMGPYAVLRALGLPAMPSIGYSGPAAALGYGGGAGMLPGGGGPMGIGGPSGASAIDYASPPMIGFTPNPFGWPIE